MTKRCLLLIFAISLFSFPYISYAQDGGYDTADSEKEESKDIAKIRKESFSQVRPGMHRRAAGVHRDLAPAGERLERLVAPRQGVEEPRFEGRDLGLGHLKQRG